MTFPTIESLASSMAKLPKPGWLRETEFREVPDGRTLEFRLYGTHRPSGREIVVLEADEVIYTTGPHVDLANARNAIDGWLANHNQGDCS